MCFRIYGSKKSRSDQEYPPTLTFHVCSQTHGVEGAAVQQTAPLVALIDLGSAAGKSRALSEGLWGRAFLTAYNSANDGERLRMAEGLGKGAGLALLAVHG